MESNLVSSNIYQLLQTGTDLHAKASSQCSSDQSWGRTSGHINSFPVLLKQNSLDVNNTGRTCGLKEDESTVARPRLVLREQRTGRNVK